MMLFVLPIEMLTLRTARFPRTVTVTESDGAADSEGEELRCDRVSPIAP